jgi:hypothetical protein
MRDINADFAHCCYSFRSNMSWRYSRTCNIKAISRNVAQKSFGHLAARRVAGAEYQDSFAVSHIYFLSCGTRTARASFDSEGTSQRNKAVAKNAPPSCARMKAGASVGLMPANVSLIDRAKVTAGFANEVEAVNQYAAVIYAATANGTADDRNRTQPQITESNPNVATNSLNT